MLSLGLSVAEERAYRRTLAGTYTLKTTLHILDLEHRIISDVSHLLIDGGVDAEMVEAEKDAEDVGIQQTYSCQLSDPGRTLGFDSGSPADASIFLDRMIKVYESVLVDEPELQGWVDCPVFCGPFNKFERDNDIITVEAQSKEAIALSRAKRNDTYKGNKVVAVRDMLLDTGEASKYIDFPEHAATTSKDVVLVWETRPWSKAWLLTRTMAKTLFYDGRGVARMAFDSSKVCFTFDGNMITDYPQTSTDSNDIRNAVKVIGSKASISYTASLPATHPLSAQSLGRKGKPRYLLEVIEDTKLTKMSQVTALANKELADRSRTATDTTFDAHPVWALEIGDLVFVNLPDFVGEVRVTKFTKPSTFKDSMTVGYARNTLKPNVTKIRRP